MTLKEPLLPSSSPAQGKMSRNSSKQKEASKLDLELPSWSYGIVIVSIYVIPLVCAIVWLDFIPLNFKTSDQPEGDKVRRLVNMGFCLGLLHVSGIGFSFLVADMAISLFLPEILKLVLGGDGQKKKIATPAWFPSISPAAAGRCLFYLLGAVLFWQINIYLRKTLYESDCPFDHILWPYVSPSCFGIIMFTLMALTFLLVRIISYAKTRATSRNTYVKIPRSP
ncbi:hypothetical protein QUC31_001035 [Theobroma cacao]